MSSPAADFTPLLFMAAILLFFYAIIIRPQQRAQKEKKQMLSEVAKGDQIVTTGGIHGRVTGVADDVLTVEIAERVRVKLSRDAVASRVAAKAAGGKE